MIEIRYNGACVYKPRLQDAVVLNPSARLAVNEAGFLRFTLPPTHPMAGKLQPRDGGEVTLMDGKTCRFRGQVISTTRSFTNMVDCEVEGLLAAMNDTIYQPFIYPDDYPNAPGEGDSRNTVKYFLQTVFQAHNSQSKWKLELGTVTVTDPNNAIYRASSKPMTCWDIIKKKVLDTLGGYLVVDYGPEIPVVSYYAELPDNGKTITFGINLLKLEAGADAAEQCTGVWPIGKDGVDLSSLPDGPLSGGFEKVGAVIHNPTLETATGRITRTMEWPNVTDPNRLKSKALAWLRREGIKRKDTLKVWAADIEDDVKRKIHVGEMVHIVSKPHGYDTKIPLLSMAPNLFDPSKTELVLDSVAPTITGQQHHGQAAIEERLSQAELTDPVPVTAVNGSGYTTEMTRIKNGKRIVGYGQITVQASIKVTVIAPIPANTEMHIGRVGFGFRPALDAAAAVSIESTNSRRYLGLIEADSGDIIIWPDTDMPPATYIFRIGSGYYTKE